jgi:hypothetical protein
MHENLIESVVHQLSPPVTPVMSAPVTREPNQASGEAGDGAHPSIMTMGPVTISFAADDAD